MWSVDISCVKFTLQCLVTFLQNSAPKFPHSAAHLQVLIFCLESDRVSIMLVYLDTKFTCCVDSQSAIKRERLSFGFARSENVDSIKHRDVTWLPLRLIY